MYRTFSFSMMVNEKMMVVLFYLCLAYTVNSEAQNTMRFPRYSHYTGNINKDMQVVADLLFTDSTAKGYYYYFFVLPGEEKTLRYSPSIPLSGKIMDGDIEIREFGNEGSVFRGRIINDTLFNGVWVDSKSLRSMPFEMKEDYSDGSVPMTTYFLSEFQKLKGIKTGKIPGAKIELNALIPSMPNDQMLAITIKKALSVAYGSGKEEITDINIFLQQIKNEYFQFYHSTTEGVSPQNAGASFNWEKKQNLEVVYNQHQLLCCQFRQYVFTGGAHGLEQSEFMVLSRKNGQRLNLDDIFVTGSRTVLDSLLNLRLRSQYSILPEKSLKEEGFFVDKIEANQNFYLNHEGIGFYFNTYVIASYNKGPVDIFIPYRYLESIINKTCLKDVLTN